MSVFKTVVGVSFLQKNPSELPYSYHWLGVFSFINILFYVAVSQALPQAHMEWLFLSHLVIQLTLFFGLLQYYRLTHRWLKFFMAILSSRLVILVVTFLMGWLLQFSPQGFVLLFGCSAIWFVLALGHIVRCTLDTSLSKGILWAILVDIVSNVLISPFLKDSFALLGTT